MNKIFFHVKIFKVANIVHFLKLIVSSQTIEISIVRDLSVCEYEEMGKNLIQPITGVRVPELHVSEDVFVSDNHDNNNKNLTIKFGNRFSSWFQM